MSTTIIILVTALICSLWSSAWLIVWASTGEPEWMTCMAGGPILWLWLGIITLFKYLIKQYYHYCYKAVVVTDTGNKYWCNSKEQDEVCEQHNVKPAFEYVKTIEYKPYKPKLYNNFYQKNPRYIHRSVACKFPKLSCIEEVKTK